VRAVTSAVDVMPTILDLARCPPALDEMQGRPLRPLWEHPERRAPRVVFAEALGVPAEMKAMRDERYKYILSISPDVVARFGRSRLPERPAAVELYDLETDPEERVNLLEASRSGPHAALGARLDAGLRAHLAGAKGKAENVELDADAIEKLKALGYIQ
jgi:arylsulfatase A-like enzyme